MTTPPPPTAPEGGALAFLLERASEKLALYRAQHSGEYIGGVEYQNLQDNIATALARYRALPASAALAGADNIERVAQIIDPEASGLPENLFGEDYLTDRDMARKKAQTILASCPQAGAWMPIETAPREVDGVSPRFLAWDCGLMEIAWEAWEEDGKPVWWAGEYRVTPTHWQPLPAPPVDAPND